MVAAGVDAAAIGQFPYHHLCRGSRVSSRGIVKLRPLSLQQPTWLLVFVGFSERSRSCTAPVR